MQRALQDLLRKRMDRAIATVLSSKEQTVDPRMGVDEGSVAASRQLRKTVLDQFNGFYEVCIDVMSSLDNGEVVLNEDYLRKIDQIHNSLANQGVRLRQVETDATG